MKYVLKRINGCGGTRLFLVCAGGSDYRGSVYGLLVMEFNKNIFLFNQYISRTTPYSLN